MIHNHEVMGGSTTPLKSLLYRVFGWMAAAVGLSGVTAVMLTQFPDLMARTIAWSPLLFIAQIGLVLLLSWRVSSLSYFTAQVLFVLYAVLMGMTLSVIFLIYTTASIAQVFLIAAGMFGAMALYGAYTKTDLAQYKSLLFMTLIGLVIAGVVNIFLKSSALDFATAVVGVLLFSALTAFDIQNIQRLGAYLIEQGEDWNKVALIAALQLYLDFINLFLSLLRLFGQRKEQ